VKNVFVIFVIVTASAVLSLLLINFCNKFLLLQLRICNFWKSRRCWENNAERGTMISSMWGIVSQIQSGAATLRWLSFATLSKIILTPVLKVFMHLCKCDLHDVVFYHLNPSWLSIFRSKHFCFKCEAVEQNIMKSYLYAHQNLYKKLSLYMRKQLINNLKTFILVIVSFGWVSYWKATPPFYILSHCKTFVVLYFVLHVHDTFFFVFVLIPAATVRVLLSCRQALLPISTLKLGPGISR